MFIILPNKARLAIEHIISYQPNGSNGVVIQTIAGDIDYDGLTVERLDAAITRATNDRRTAFSEGRPPIRQTALAS